jgi:hypothetical protein
MSPRSGACGLLVAWAALVGTVALFPCGASGQTDVRKAHPDALRFGTLYPGATAEASVRLFECGEDPKAAGLKVEPPPFVKLLRHETGKQYFGPNAPQLHANLSFSLEARQPGNLSGTIKVQFGRQQVDVPVSATVKARVAGLTRVLVTETPFDAFSTNDASIFQPWLDLVDAAKLDVHYYEAVRSKPVLRDSPLADFDVILVCETAMVYLTDQDAERLKEFVEKGGRLVLCADRFYVGTADRANGILAAHGLHLADEETGLDATYDFIEKAIREDPLTLGLKRISCRRLTPIEITDAAKGKILVSSPVQGKGFVAVTRPGQGEIVVLGLSLWWNWIGGPEGKDSDNAKLLKNLLTRPRQ